MYIENIDFIGVAILPTTAQALTCFDLCQRLTNFYLPVYLVRLNRRIHEVLILAGEETEILIERDGNWKY